MLATMCGGKIVDKLRCEFHHSHNTHLCLITHVVLDLHVVSSVRHTGALFGHVVSVYFSRCDMKQTFHRLFPVRHLLTDLRLQWSHDVCEVRPVPAGGAEAPHGRVRGPLVRLHGALGADVLPPAGRCCWSSLVLTSGHPLHFSNTWTRTCVCVFCLQKKIMLNTFLDVLMADPPPQCLVWLPLMHRLANVENGETLLSVLT